MTVEDAGGDEDRECEDGMGRSFFGRVNASLDGGRRLILRV
jgi:hypothetical protein